MKRYLTDLARLQSPEAQPMLLARAGAATCGAAPAYHGFHDILDAAGKEAVTDP